MNQKFKTALSILILILFYSCKSKDGNPSTDPIQQSAALQNYGTGFELLPQQSIIYWLGSSPTGTHNGSLKFKESKLFIDQAGNLAGGVFNIDMTTIANLDISDPDEKKDFEENMKSGNFFQVDSFPTAEFRIVAVTASKDSLTNAIVDGELTIKSITKPLRIKAHVNIAENIMLIIIPEFIIDRTEWGINYNSKKIFSNLLDNLINDEIKINMKILALRK
ncbi:MAG: YceI family protein [Saprospiraceae bacterium]|nr:YceI family protein [Candidatus Vicinibacter affinis]MBP6174497.1 YceI family protein [Saprospiraceae bacterium]MBK6573327.1 YceI family protein [Candidatus Vicinibacter affinis]MBK7693149.1 YceI family protein [Candidatus Vicinibacter affinis]MBK7797955.1 YceI family protein [Candidatus Vicinibacter affinis]